MDLENEALFTRHIGALFKKRAAVFRRDKKAWCCTTIVPSIFVLIGFLLFKFAAPQRDLDPIFLDLNDYNPRASNPRNPIVFNSAENPFQCQPGFCAYYPDTIVSITTGESYFYCGSQAGLDDKQSSCTITESDSIVREITYDGAEPKEANLENGNVTTIEEVSTLSANLLSNCDLAICCSNHRNLSSVIKKPERDGR